MRSLYWLTAVTLVAAAVTTVAIADYGRRHPQTVAAWWGSSARTTTVPECCEKTSEPSTAYVTEGGSHKVVMERAPILPPINPPTVSDDSVPSLPPSTGTPIRVEDVPEHQQLKDAALKQLTLFQSDVPQLPPVTQPAAPGKTTADEFGVDFTPQAQPSVTTQLPSNNKQPVVDEFTFSDKPLAPLYVPLQPDAKVILPPTKMMQEVAKLPNIPGVSLTAPSVTPPVANQSKAFNSLPSYQVESARGPEVMPGLHAAKPVEPEGENPVRDTMLGLGELISAMNPTTYLMSLPVQKKSATPTAFATTEVKATPVPCDDTATCPVPTTSTKSACCKEGACCKEAAPGDDVVVRTYSVAEFTTSAGTNHDDLVRLITTMVAPESWNTRDSNVEYFPLGKCLVVRHRTSVQDQVDDLLTQLRGQVHKQNKGLAPSPAVHHEATVTMPVELELVPLAPRECTERMPRVITIDPTRCTGDDEFFGMIPMSPDGRLLAVPMTLPKLQSTALVPAQFEPKPQDTLWLEDGPASKNAKPRAPEFFPWFLPYAPLPNGPDSCEEELLNRVGFVSYSDEEIAYLFLMACEAEESK